MGVEYELKFRANADVQQAIYRAYPGQETVYKMQTTYYDTPSRSLSARKYTLRRRLENDLSVCTLKAPAGGAARGEWEIPCEDITAAIPQLCALGAPTDLPELVKDGVYAICGAAFTRIAILIRDGDCVLELALDSGILTAGNRSVPLCEVEVELKEGTREDANRFAAALAAAYGLLPEKRSKFRRALALAEGEAL